jgi:hypothetical protein
MGRRDLNWIFVKPYCKFSNKHIIILLYFWYFWVKWEGETNHYDGFPFKRIPLKQMKTIMEATGRFKESWGRQ